MSEFEGVEDTLFIPLTARICVSKKFPEYFFDQKALEMEDLIKNKKIDENSTEYSIIANVARCYNLDRMTKEFIAKHGKCNIVNLGVGLETSYYRIDDKNSLFYEVDLPEVIELREKYLKPGLNEKFIKGDLFKLDWCNELDTNLPTLLIVAGVFQYFHENDVVEFIDNVKDIFENAELIFDAANKFGNLYCNFYVKRTGNKSAMMYFYINDEVKFAKKVNCQLIECRGFYKDALRILDEKLGLYSRAAMRIADNRKNTMIIHLKL